MSTLDPAEWDFSSVSDDNLKACCYYEYAREAERHLWEISALRQSVDFRDSQLAPGEIASAELQSDRAKLQKLELNNPRAPLFQFLLTGPTEDELSRIRSGQPLREYVHPPAWQLLPPKKQIEATEIIQQRRELRLGPDPVAVLSSEKIHILSQCGVLVPLKTDGISINALGLVHVPPLAIDFKNNTDAKILEHLAGLIQSWRKELVLVGGDEYEQREGKGRKNSDLRAALQNLGLTRLRHHVPVRVIAEKLSSHSYRCWGKNAPLSEIKEAIDKDRRRRCRERFKLQHPDLGPDAEPACCDSLPVQYQ